VAGVVGSKTDSPELAFLFGLISHLVLDAIPHYDTTDAGKFTTRQIVVIFGDSLIGLAIIFFYLKPEEPTFFWGVLGGVILDIMDNVPFWSARFRQSPIGRPIHRIHSFVQRIKVRPLIGILTQVTVIVLALAFAGRS